MPIFDLFSKRQKRLRGELPDVYSYDVVPDQLRVQVVHILRDAIGETGNYRDEANKIWQTIHDGLAREYGRFRLGDGRGHDESAIRFFLDDGDHEKLLDFIELAFRCVDRLCREPWFASTARPSATPDEAISELNGRLREHGVGYQFESGELVRVDSAVIHAEVVKPTLQLLRAKVFQGANAEYLRAFEHYRHARFEESIADCLKALESTMKVILHKRRCGFSPNDTAKRLLELCFESGLIPAYLQSEFSALRTTLESGVPTVRNKQSGHGQGAQLRSIPRHLASYVIHLTGTNILFLVEADAAS